MHRLGKAGSCRVHGPCGPQDVHQHVIQDGRGDKVEHDRGDHDVTAPFGLQICRDRRPNCTKGGGPDRRTEHSQCPMRPRDKEAHKCHAKTAQHRLTLAANVEQARMKRHGDRQSREHEICRVIKRVAPTIGGPKRAGYHEFHSRHRILANGKNHECRQHCGQDQRDQRNEHNLGPFGHHVHSFAPLSAQLQDWVLRTRDVSGGFAPVACATPPGYFGPKEGVMCPSLPSRAQVPFHLFGRAGVRP
mmetsp:Transcript_24005/g.44033  ORF Transcript_24005/g.44033 Transcript_24005/m.44033 type:complete len:246 (+) Transcript_24005:1932-2669(+)